MYCTSFCLVQYKNHEYQYWYGSTELAVSPNDEFVSSAAGSHGPCVNHGIMASSITNTELQYQVLPYYNSILVWQVSFPRNLAHKAVQNAHVANRNVDMTSPKEYLLVLEASVPQ